MDWDNFALAFCQYYSLNPSTLGPETTTYKCAKLALGMPPPLSVECQVSARTIIVIAMY